MRTILLALCTNLVLLAAPPLTLIEDTLYRADGSRFSGTAFISWRSFEAGDTSNIPMQNVAVRIVNGSIRVQLVPTTNASPGAYYDVRFNSNGRIQFAEYWAVPPSNVPLRLRDVRIQGPLGSSQITPPVNTAILIPDISGLREELDARPLKGAGYSISRAAIINSAGELESALGDPADCIHVDGSSGTCGSGGGGGGSPVIFVDNETPSGARDGSNRTFILSATPNPVSSLQLFRNGVLQAAGIDYTLSGTTVTMLPVSTPEPLDALLASYRVTTVTPGITFEDAERPAGAINSLNTQFTLASTPSPAASIAVYRNGILQQAGVDFTVSGNVLTFAGPSIPQTGDSLQAFYRH
jgi:hypothetical protein